MSLPPEPPDEAELHALADDRLPPERTSAVKAWLAGQAGARERVARWQRQNELIGCLYHELDQEPLPARLRPALLARNRRAALRQLAAAVAAALLAGGGGGWFARGLILSDDEGAEEIGIAQDAARAHRRLGHAASFDVDAGAQARLIAWLAQRLGHRVRVPDLTETGLQLLGGRALLGSEGKQAVQLVYEDAAGQPFTLYMIWASEPEPTEFRFFRLDHTNAFYWPHNELRCVLAGDADPDRLLDIAQGAYDEMEGEDQAPEG